MYLESNVPERGCIDSPAKAQIANFGVIAVEIAGLEIGLGRKAAVARADDDRVALKDGWGCCSKTGSAQDVQRERDEGAHI